MNRKELIEHIHDIVDDAYNELAEKSRTGAYSAALDDFRFKLSMELNLLKQEGGSDNE